jgi:hypothetical protein
MERSIVVMELALVVLAIAAVMALALPPRPGSTTVFQGWVT